MRVQLGPHLRMVAHAKRPRLLTRVRPHHFLIASYATAVANLSELQSPAKNVRLEGMMTRLSPMKRSGKTSKSLYFDGELSDGQTAMRVYGYDSKVREKLEDRACQKEGVRLIGVDITKSRVGEECEIYLKSDAYISGCKSLFDVDCDMGGSKQSKAVELRDVKDMKAGMLRERC